MYEVVLLGLPFDSLVLLACLLLALLLVRLVLLLVLLHCLYKRLKIIIVRKRILNPLHEED